MSIIKHPNRKPTIHLIASVTFDEALLTVMKFAESEDIDGGHFSWRQVDQLEAATRLIREKLNEKKLNGNECHFDIGDEVEILATKVRAVVTCINYCVTGQGRRDVVTIRAEWNNSIFCDPDCRDSGLFLPDQLRLIGKWKK